MSRSIQEGDLLPVLLYHIGADMLGDTAGLAADHVGVTDSVQKGGLTMVNMTHNADYRRTLLHLLLVLFLLLQQFLDHVNHFFFLTEDIKLQRDLFRGFVIDLLVDGNDLTLHEQLLHDHRRNHFHLIRQFLDGQHLRNGDGLDLFFLLLSLRLRFLKLRLILRLLLLALWLSVLFLMAVIFLLMIVLPFSFASLRLLGGSLRSRDTAALVPSALRTSAGTAVSSLPVSSGRAILSSVALSSWASVISALTFLPVSSGSTVLSSWRAVVSSFVSFASLPVSP